MFGGATIISFGPVFHGVGNLSRGSGSGCGGGIEAVRGKLVAGSAIGVSLGEPGCLGVSPPEDSSSLLV